MNVLGIIILFFIGEYIFTQEIGIESISVFNILLIANLIVVPSILIGYPFLAALGFAKCANRSVIYGLILHLLGLALLSLTNNIGIHSVAYMVMITESFVLIYRIYYVKQKIGEKLK